MSFKFVQRSALRSTPTKLVRIDLGLRPLRHECCDFPRRACNAGVRVGLDKRGNGRILKVADGIVLCLDCRSSRHPPPSGDGSLEVSREQEFLESWNRVRCTVKTVPSNSKRLNVELSLLKVVVGISLAVCQERRVCKPASSDVCPRPVPQLSRVLLAQSLDRIALMEEPCQDFRLLPPVRRL